MNYTFDLPTLIFALVIALLVAMFLLGFFIGAIRGRYVAEDEVDTELADRVAELELLAQDMVWPHRSSLELLPKYDLQPASMGPGECRQCHARVQLSETGLCLNCAHPGPGAAAPTSPAAPGVTAGAGEAKA